MIIKRRVYRDTNKNRSDNVVLQVFYDDGSSIFFCFVFSTGLSHYFLFFNLSLEIELSANTV
jgi:hypothetical protein